MTNEKYVTANNSLAAFCIALGFSFRLVNVKGNINIEISGPGLKTALENFYANSLVPVQSYIGAFNTLRGAISIAKENENI